MFFYRNSAFSIYFGNAEDALYQPDYYALAGISSVDLVSNPLFSFVKKDMSLSSLVFLKQVHGVSGKVVRLASESIKSFEQEGDFLITNQLGIGIGVMTADCAPIIFYDPIHKVSAIAHAGWRGAVKGIVIKVIARMQKEYGTDVKNIQIFFGPSAQKCCYQVSPDFINNIKRTDFLDAVIVRRLDDIFFNLQEYNKQLLQDYGVPIEAFNCFYAQCTICDNSFFSHRRQGSLAGRQMTIIALK